VILGGKSGWNEDGNWLVEKIAGDCGRSQIVSVVTESSDEAKTVVPVGGKDRESKSPDSSVGDKQQLVREGAELLAVKRLGRRWIVNIASWEVFVDCLQLAKEDQATYCPMVNNRSLQTNNNRFRPEITIGDLVSTVRPHSVIVPNIN
jgi:hypothetical protein